MKKKVKATRSKTQSVFWGLRDYFFLLAGLVFFGLILIQTPSYTWMHVPFTIQNPTLWGFLLILSLTAVGYGLSRMPPEPSSVDFSKPAAYGLLFVILAVAAYIRMFRADQSYSGYWADPGTEIADVRDMVDKHSFQLIFPGGAREPFWAWIAAIIWWIFPTFKALLVQRLASNFINLVTIWLFYRVGREWSGKRLTGILFAALGAASKPLIILDLSGMRVTTATFAVSLILLAQIKLFQKKSLKHYLFWGLALAASLYTYTIVRVLVPVLALVTLIWTLQDKESQKASGWTKTVCWALFVLYSFFYADRMLAFMYQNLFSKIWGGVLPVWFFWQAFFGLLLFLGYEKGKSKGKWLCAWGFGFLLVGILTHPIALHTEGAARISDQSVLPKNLGGWFSSDFVHNLSVWIGQTFSALFYAGRGRSDMTILGDCFFEFQAALLVGVGLLFVLVRRTAYQWLLVALTVVGLVPYLFTADLHAAKLLSASVTLLLLASMVLGTVVENSWRVKAKGHWPAILLVLVLLAGWVWELQGSYTRVYDKWWWEVWNDDVCMERAADQFLPQDHVYLVRIPDSIHHPNQFFDANTQSVLHDTCSVYLFQPVNPIPVRAGEAKPGVAVLVSPLMPDLVNQLKKQFPRAVWGSIWQYYQKSHDEVPFLYTMQIASEDIADKPGKLFYYMPADADAWVRRTYITRMCLREGVVDKEDASMTLNPFVPGNGGQPLSAEKNWTAPADGDYTFTLRSGDPAQLIIDDHEIETIFPGKGIAIARVSLKKGPHRVHLAGYLMSAPALKIENKDAHYQADLSS